MNVVAALFVGRAKANHGLATNQRRTHIVGLRFSNRSFNGIGMMAVDFANHLPAIGRKPLGRLVSEPAADMTINRDSVVVIKRDQFGQAPCTRQRTNFVGNAFHQATIAEEHIGKVIDDIKVRTIELLGEQLFRQRHSDRVGQSLAQRPGSSFYAGRIAKLRMARRFAVQLAKIFEVVNRQIVSGQMQEGIHQHRAMTVRQNKTITIGPRWIFGVVPQMMIP